jgi:aminopeptidase N
LKSRDRRARWPWLLAVAAFAVTAAPPRPAAAEAGACSRARAALACPAGMSRQATVGLVTDSAATDVLHYDLDIALDPAAASLSGTNRMTVRVVAETLSTFTFQLANQLAVTSLQVDGEDARWLRLDALNVEVTIAPPRLAGDELVLAVGFQGRPDPSSDGIYFQNRGGWPLVFTLSEPTFAPMWWPVKDDNTDKATADVRVTVPSGLTVASNGLLVAEEPLSGSRTRFHWHTDYPTAPYLIFLSAARYNRFSGTWQHDGAAMPLQFFFFPDEDTTANRTRALATVTMLDTLGSAFGPYPFAAEKYGLYQWTFGGGMEHQTMTGQDSFSELLTVHELAHQWWGDLVTCATWHDIWLNEGFATYAEALWAERKPGSSGLAALTQLMLQNRPRDASGTVYVSDLSDVDRIFSADLSYRKGAWVLHMLRHVMGDRAFFDLLLEWRRENAYSSNTTEGFRILAEAIHGSDLSWFFDEWVYGGGMPEYSVGWRGVRAAGRDWVEVSLQQVQTDAGAFRMPIDVRLWSGQTYTTAVVSDTGASSHALLSVSAPVDGVELDPDHWVLAISRFQVPFVEGPPRIVATAPAPGAGLASSNASAVSVTFQKDVTVRASDLRVEAEGTGPVAFTLSYDRASTTATLAFAAPLPPGRYTLTVSDLVTDTASGQRLDGEIGTPAGPAALPSGDGQPGGSAVVTFRVSAVARRHLRR